MLGQALLGFMTVDALFAVTWATLLGIAVGALPGLTATLGVALMTTLTFKMAANDAILILICMYIGAIYGGSRSAILLNIPGTPANAATTLDGFPLARRGEAGRAMGIATTGSFLGSMIGILFLATIAPRARRVRARFRRLRVLLAGRLRDRDLRPSDRARRSDQGLDLGLFGPARGDGRAGGRARLPALCLWQRPILQAASACCRPWSGRSASPRS